MLTGFRLAGILMQPALLTLTVAIAILQDKPRALQPDVTALLKSAEHCINPTPLELARLRGEVRKRAERLEPGAKDVLAFLFTPALCRFNYHE